MIRLRGKTSTNSNNYFNDYFVFTKTTREIGSVPKFKNLTNFLLLKILFMKPFIFIVSLFNVTHNIDAVIKNNKCNEFIAYLKSNVCLTNAWH